MGVRMGRLMMGKDCGSGPARWPAKGVELTQSNEKYQASGLSKLKSIRKSQESGTKEIKYKVSFQVQSWFRDRRDAQSVVPNGKEVQGCIAWK